MVDKSTLGSYKKRTKRLLFPDAGSKIRDLAGKYVVYEEDDDWEGGSNYESFSTYRLPEPSYPAPGSWP
jgi:hypothetical protein